MHVCRINNHCDSTSYGLMNSNVYLCRLFIRRNISVLCTRGKHKSNALVARLSTTGNTFSVIKVCNTAFLPDIFMSVLSFNIRMCDLPTMDSM